MPSENRSDYHLTSDCFVTQADRIAANEVRIRHLHDIIGDANSLSLSQSVHFYAVALEYKPDLVIELGRGYGNSTAMFTEAANNNDVGKVISYCITDCWDVETMPRLAKEVPESWFNRLEALREDILNVDFQAVVGEARRILVLWDAHGIEVADCVLAHLMPAIADREHFVIMHDISDDRYCGTPKEYRGLPYFRGQNGAWSEETAALRIGWIDTKVDQTVPALDFLSRNDLELGSADHIVNQNLYTDRDLWARLKESYPDGFIDNVNHWAYFSLNDTKPPFRFPAYPAPQAAASEQDTASSAETDTPAAQPSAKVAPAGPILPETQWDQHKPPPEPPLEYQVAADLERSKLFGLRTPLTFFRVMMKFATRRYPHSA